MSLETEGETLVEAALKVLNTADPFEKAHLGDAVATKWLHGTITQSYNPSVDLLVPDRPARLSNVKLVSPSQMPKLGRAGTLQSRQAIVHSLVHTESWAIDLSWSFRTLYSISCKLAFMGNTTHLILAIHGENSTEMW